MKKEKRGGTLYISAFALIAIAGVIWFWFGRERRPDPVASNYYTGPFKNKANPNQYATDDGKIVGRPAGEPVSTSKGGGPMGGQ